MLPEQNGGAYMMKRIIAVPSVWIGMFIFALPVFAQANNKIQTEKQGIGIETIINIISIAVIVLSVAIIAFLIRRMKGNSHR